VYKKKGILKMGFAKKNLFYKKARGIKNGFD